MPPGDKNSEEKMESAEAGGEEPCAPGRGAKHRKTAEDHKADAHDWNCGHGKRAAGDDARAVEQEPCGWQRRSQAHPVKREREKGTGDQWRKKSECNFAAGAGENWQPSAIGFPEDREQRDGEGEQTFAQPNAKPGESRRLARGKPGSAESGEAENHLSPAGNGGERCGALHGVTDEAQIADGVGIRGTSG